MQPHIYILRIHPPPWFLNPLMYFNRNKGVGMRNKWRPQEQRVNENLCSEMANLTVTQVCRPQCQGLVTQLQF